MILTLLFIGIGVIGIGLIVAERNVYGMDEEWMYLGAILATVGITLTLILVVMIAFVPLNFTRDVATYQMVSSYLESVADNTQMTSEERIRTLENITKINMDILTTRVQSANPWINWFYAAEYGEFELLSFDAVPAATFDVQLNE